MKRLNRMGSLPKAVQYLARNLLDMGKSHVHLYECSPDEMLSFDPAKDLVFQLVFADDVKKFFYVGARDEEKTSTGIYLPETFPAIYFALVDDAWIRARRQEADRWAKADEEERQYWQEVEDHTRRVRYYGDKKVMIFGNTKDNEYGVIGKGDDWL